MARQRRYRSMQLCRTCDEVQAMFKETAINQLITQEQYEFRNNDATDSNFCGCVRSGQSTFSLRPPISAESLPATRRSASAVQAAVRTRNTSEPIIRKYICTSMQTLKLRMLELVCALKRRAQFILGRAAGCHKSNFAMSQRCRAVQIAELAPRAAALAPVSTRTEREVHSAMCHQLLAIVFHAAHATWHISIVDRKQLVQGG